MFKIRNLLWFFISLIILFLFSSFFIKIEKTINCEIYNNNDSTTTIFVDEKYDKFFNNEYTKTKIIVDKNYVFNVYLKFLYSQDNYSIYSYSPTIPLSTLGLNVVRICLGEKNFYQII